MILEKHTFQIKYTHDGYYYKETFPITLAYVIIGRKSQGTTINSKFIINIKEAFAPSLTYDALKGHKLKKMKKIGNLTPNDLVPCTFEED
jgi:hypothetical protein